MISSALGVEAPLREVLALFPEGHYEHNIAKAALRELFCS